MRLWPHGGLWRHGDFLRFWSAQTISQFGSQVSQLALPLAAILVLDASAFEVALLGAVEFLPFLLFALPAGVWVDRLRRKPILVLGDLGRALALASIPLTYAFDALTIWQLYTIGFVVGVGTVFFDVAYQSYLPSLVDRDHLVDGNSKLEISRSAAQLAGPGLAGLLIGALTAPYAIFVDAVSFLGSAGLIFRIRCEEDVPEPAEQPSMRRELSEGIRYLLGHPYWRPIAAAVAISNFFTTLGFSIILVYAVRELNMSSQMIGIVFSVGNLGWMLGAFTASRLPGRLDREDSCWLSDPLRSIDAARSHRTAVVPDSIHHRIVDPAFLRGCGVQRHGTQLSAGRDPGSPPWPAERDQALHRVGSYPPRLNCRRHPCFTGWPATHVACRSRRGFLREPASTAVPGAVDRNDGQRRPGARSRVTRVGCLSYPRSKPGCASSTRSFRRRRSSTPGRLTSRP
jgi:MFS family permease